LVSPTGDLCTSDADGKFFVPVPSSGQYQLHAHHSDWGGIDVTVTAPQRGVKLQLERRASLEVRVLAEVPVEGAEVVLYADGTYRSDRPSGADGLVVLRGLPAGDYVMMAGHPKMLPSARVPVRLTDGEVLRTEVALERGAAVHGRVVDESGNPLVNIRVSVFPPTVEAATTDSQGEFRLGPLSASKTISVRAHERGFDSMEASGVTPGGPPLTIVLKRQAVFRGRVLGDGRPLKSFRVDDVDVVAAGGGFELPLETIEGRVVFTIEAVGYESLIVERAATKELGDFDLKRAAEVTGWVRGDDGAAVTDATVTCDVCEQLVRSGAGGRFSLAMPPFQREVSIIAKKGRRTATKLVVEGASAGVELVLRAGVKVFGTVTAPDGSPAAGVEISGIHVDVGDSISAVTDAVGAYSMDVPPGLYRFITSLSSGPVMGEDPQATIVELREAQTRLDFGSPPDQGELEVHLPLVPGAALWVVRGRLQSVANPPMELLRSSWAQLVYNPRQTVIRVGGLSPGTYSVVWGGFHAPTDGGPQIRVVEVPGQRQVSFVR
jgi:hypothetical protein